MPVTLTIHVLELRYGLLMAADSQTLPRTTWNRLLTGRPQGYFGKVDYSMDEPHFMSYYCRPDQFEEIEVDAGEPFSEEHKAACVRLDEITGRVARANPDEDGEEVILTRADFDELRELARVADEAQGLSLVEVLDGSL